MVDQPSQGLVDGFQGAVSRLVIQKPASFFNAAIRGMGDVVPSGGRFFFGDGVLPFIP